jgi:hypothetical protein
MKQYYNKKIGAYVKGEVKTTKKGGKYFKVKDVKQKDPKKPFRNVPMG